MTFVEIIVQNQLFWVNFAGSYRNANTYLVKSNSNEKYGKFVIYYKAANSFKGNPLHIKAVKKFLYIEQKAHQELLRQNLKFLRERIFEPRKWS
jgi:hypothetical protein